MQFVVLAQGQNVLTMKIKMYWLIIKPTWKINKVVKKKKMIILKKKKKKSICIKLISIQLANNNISGHFTEVTTSHNHREKLHDCLRGSTWQQCGMEKWRKLIQFVASLEYCRITPQHNSTDSGEVQGRWLMANSWAVRWCTVVTK